MRTLKYFMWGYQEHFQISVQSEAKRLFSKLDPDLDPSVLLVGVLTEEREDRHPICISPEDGGYDAHSFSDLVELAEHLEEADFEKKLMHTHPRVQKNHESRLRRKALSNAVVKSLYYSYEYENRKTYCSLPVEVDCYQVMVAVQLRRNVLESHYSLVQTLKGRQPLITSLIDATMKVFLRECTKALAKENPGEAFREIDRDQDELIREAGDIFMASTAHRLSDFGANSLYNEINAIASMPYEGEEGIGKIILAKQPHPNVESILKLQEPATVRSIRATRKLLEMSTEDLNMISDGRVVYGFGHIFGHYNDRIEDLFIIDFIEHYTWQLLHNEHVMMQVKYGQPRLIRSRLNKAKFLTDIPRIFSNVQGANVGRLWKLVEAATEQKHGTMVVISEAAEGEAQRLKNQATLIEPIRLTSELMRSVTAIDGAVLIDPAGTCFAVGVILDGLASEKGTPTRGARYNSAIRYIETTTHACLAVVVSEDGSIDLIPDLRPQIKRSMILEKIETLQDLTSKERFSLKEFARVMNWFEEHVFYLLPEMCVRINRLRREVEKVRDEAVEPEIIRPRYSDFEPNPEMDESYFLPE